MQTFRLPLALVFSFFVSRGAFSQALFAPGPTDSLKYLYVYDYKAKKEIKAADALPYKKVVSKPVIQSKVSIGTSQGFDISSMASNRDYVWFGTKKNGVIQVNKLTNSSIVLNSDNSSLASDRVFAVSVDHSGCLWVLTDLGLFSIQGENTTHFKFQNDRGSMVCDSNNAIWMVCSLGLLKIKDDKFVLHNSISESKLFLPDEIIGTYVDHQNTIWLASSLGLISIDKDSTNLDKKFIIDSHDIHFINCKDGHLLLKANDKKLYIYSNHQMQKINLPHIFTIDPNENFYIVENDLLAKSSLLHYIVDWKIIKNEITYGDIKTFKLPLYQFKNLYSDNLGIIYLVDPQFGILKFDPATSAVIVVFKIA